jgi:hypothetical protein
VLVGFDFFFRTRIGTGNWQATRAATGTGNCPFSSSNQTQNWNRPQNLVYPGFGSEFLKIKNSILTANNNKNNSNNNTSSFWGIHVDSLRKKAQFFE